MFFSFFSAKTPARQRRSHLNVSGNHGILKKIVFEEVFDMKLLIPSGSSAADLEKCEFFSISHDNWNYGSAPAASGKLLYADGEGFYLYMRCDEADPCSAKIHADFW